MVRKLNKSFCTLLLLAMCAAPAVYAQKTATIANDTLPLKRTDSLFNDLKDNVQDNLPSISVDENDLGDGGSGQGVSSVLSAGRDPYYNAASFNFSEMRFRIRGYDNDNFGTFMNGIPMENLDNGGTPFGLWGGLNDVMRNRDVSYGLRPNPFSFGDIGSNTNIDSRASIQRKQTSFGYAFSNRNYGHRWMLTHSTGMSKKGWAFSFSGSRRWAGEGYVPGTYYDGWSYFAAIDKKINNNHLLSLTVFGAPTENGRSTAAVQEMMDLAGSNYYNPLWGYQNGKKRNSSIGKSNQPVIILTHDARLSDVSKLTTAVGYSWGDRSVTALDWYNISDPRPDYYRYLPSYYGSNYYNGVGGYMDSARYNYLVDAMSKDESLRQVNWDKLYDVNRGQFDVIQNANGIQGNTVSGRRSRYVVENRIVNTKRFNVNSVYNTLLGKNIDFTAGAFLQVQENHYYKTIDDLLGGDFYVNVNGFAERDFGSDNIHNQWDLLHPNRILHVGDKYGYDYLMEFDKVGGWAQTVFRFNKLDVFAAGQLSHVRFWRIGLNKNGLYPDDSYGGSERTILNNYAAKGGLTYKMNGRNYFFLNGTIQTKAPFFENVFQSLRTRNTLVNNITNEKIQSVEGGYIMNAPKLKVRLNGYYTRFQDGMDVITYYDDFYNSFGNISLTNIDKVHFGGEFGIEGNLGHGLTANAAAAVGRYYYDSRQKFTLTIDNTSEVIDNDVTVYSKNYRVPSTPQEAYSLGLTYRSPKFWFVSVTGNYYRQSWLSFSPIRRTETAVNGLTEDDKLRQQILAQQQLDDQFMLNFFGGWSYKLPKNFNISGRSTFLVFNLGVNNILNNKNAVTGGFEQLRFDDENRNVNKFPPKYFYAWGLNYFASATIRF